jgi:hypothetical protein
MASQPNLRAVLISWIDIVSVRRERDFHMSDDLFVLNFLNVSIAEANQYATDLATNLRDASQDAIVEQRRTRSDTQDFGATLVIVLGTASATAIANGVASWLMRHSGARIEISRHGAVVATNLDSRDAAKIAEAFSR